MIRTPAQHQTDPMKAPGFYKYPEVTPFDQWYHRMVDSSEGWWVLDYDKYMLKEVFNAGLSF